LNGWLNGWLDCLRSVETTAPFLFFHFIDDATSSAGDAVEKFSFQVLLRHATNKTVTPAAQHRLRSAGIA